MKPLVDSYGRSHSYLRISVTDKCNLRCSYCRPRPGGGAQPDSSLHRSELMCFDEIERVSAIASRLGVTKLRITGGEPLVRSGVASLVSRLARIPGIETLGMTTNGVLLSKHALALKEAGLTHLNISLDTLRPDRFTTIALHNRYEDVRKGIDAALAAGFSRLKLNVVVMGGVNDDELPDFVEFACAQPIEVRFIEFMPFKFNQWTADPFVSYVEMIRRIELRDRLTPIERQDGCGSVAKTFLVNGGEGRIGFITSMSEHFCNSCNRFRLTADGSIKSCLFHPAEINLRDPMRAGASDEEIEELIRRALIQKPEGHLPAEQLRMIENRTMVEIGG